jgi:hypothetical protein
MKSAVHLDAHTVADIEFQPASLDIWDAKYRLAAKDGAKIDATIDDTYKRVAKAAILRRVSLGAPERSDTGGSYHVECRSAGTQAGDIHDQLHGIGYRRRFDG